MGRKGGRKPAKMIVCAILALALLGALMLPGVGVAQQKSGPAKTLRIGYILCLSGWYSVFDGMEERHLKAVADMINDRGGIAVQGQKYKVELVGEDGKSTMDGISAAATRLVFDDKVKFVIGPDAFFSLGSSPIFEQGKVLHVSGYNSSQPGEMDASTPYGFLGFNCTMGLLGGVMKVMKKDLPNVKKVVLTSADDGAIPYIIPLVKKALAAKGYTAIDVVTFPNEMEDFSPIAAKANAIKDADAYMNLLSSPVAIGGIIKGLRSLGNTKPVICVQTVPVSEILAICGKQAGDNVMVSAFIPLAKGNPPLVDEVFNRTGKKPPMFLLNPNGLWELAKVIQAANSLDPAVVKAKWESMDKVDTLFGPGIVCGDETYGIKHHAVVHPVPYSKLVKGEVVNGGWVEATPVP